MFNLFEWGNLLGMLREARIKYRVKRVGVHIKKKLH